MIQFLSQKLSYITFKTVFELALYVMSLLLTIDFPFYQLNNIRQLVGIHLAEQLEVKPIKNFQQETGLRLVGFLQYFFFSHLLSSVHVLYLNDFENRSILFIEFISRPCHYPRKYTRKIMLQYQIFCFVFLHFLENYDFK